MQRNFSVVLFLIVFTSGCAQNMPGTAVFDTVIVGGTVVDGSGDPAFRADIGIVDGRIVAIGALSQADAIKKIDASGRLVTPGFIDLHNHADRNIGDSPGVENYLFQGVTTILTGNCGNSPVDIGDFWNTLAQTGTGPNVGILIGHNGVRRAVMANEDRRPTSEEQAAMEQLIQSAMDAGAFGMSTGLIYLPGTYSETEEVVGLASVVAREGGIYTSHIRSESEQIVAAIDEAIQIGRETGVPVHISHFKIASNRMWGQSTVTLGLVQNARDAGLDVSIDQYPYTAASTGLANILPAWARAGTRAEFRARLDDPETRARIKAESIEKLYGARAAGDLSRITVASFQKFPEYVGKTMKEVTVMRGYEPTIENGAEVAMELLYEGSGSAIYHMMVEEDVQRILLAPFTHVASDGSAVAYGVNVPHLRNYGAFPRVLRKYVADEPILTIEEAIHKMTRMPAMRMGLPDRGLISKGAIADLNVFALENIQDNDDWARPHQYAQGFDYVLVNGVIAIEKGVRTETMPGEALKHSRFTAGLPAD